MEQLQGHGFLEDLALVMCVAAVTTVLFRLLKQPVVLGYLIAGMIVGPHIPIPLLADLDRVHTLSELGVILVMFAIGLEFSFRKLARVGPTAGLIALIQVSVMLWLGFIVGRAFGWSVAESLFTGAMIAISSTMIIAKAFSELKMKGRIVEIVMGVLIIEDLVAILLLAILTAFSAGKGLSAGELTLNALRLILFLSVLLVAGLLIIPPAIRKIVKLETPETILVASIGICFAFAVLAQKLGYSVALGAFVAGTLVAESGAAHRIEALIGPIRDMFAAVFFISVGMLIDPSILLQYWVAIAVLTLVVIVGKVVSVSSGTFLSGYDIRTSIQAGMSMAQIGEFSFIIAAAGLASGAIREFLYPVAVAVCVITTFTTPWFIRSSHFAACWMDRKLPAPFQTLAGLYGSWVEQLRKPALPGTAARIRKLLWLLLLDSAVIALIVAGATFGPLWYEKSIRELTGFSKETMYWIIRIAAFAAILPFIAGTVRCARALGIIIATHALPSKQEGLDLAQAPRKLLTITIQAGIFSVIGIAILAVTQPFLPSATGTIFLAVAIIVIIVVIWVSAADLEGHVRAGAQVIIEALAGRITPDEEQEVVKRIHDLLPGFGNLHPVHLKEGDISVGKTISELNLRGLTGATIIGIIRGTNGIPVPAASETLEPGDIVALIGSAEAIYSARSLLTKSTG